MRRPCRAADGKEPARRFGPARRTVSGRGFALVAVLWALVLLGLVFTHLGAIGRSETRLARNLAAAARAEALAEAGIEQAVFQLADPEKSTRWRPDRGGYRLVLPGGEVTVDIRDEAGRINPSLAPKELLTELLLAFDVPGDRAGDIASAMEEAGKKAAFGHLGELLELPGLDAPLLARLAPHLSIDNPSGIPDYGRADSVVRHALDQLRLPSAPPLPEDAGAVRVVAAARMRDGAVFVREAVLRRDMSLGQPARIVQWGRGDRFESGTGP